jgi:hypothetical protein
MSFMVKVGVSKLARWPEQDTMELMVLSDLLQHRPVKPAQIGGPDVEDLFEQTIQNLKDLGWPVDGEPDEAGVGNAYGVSEQVTQVAFAALRKHYRIAEGGRDD